MNDETNDQPENDEQSFAELFEQSMVSAPRLEPGQKTSATVLQISAEWVFLDVGQKGEGVLDLRELQDSEGKLTAKPGDRLDVYFLSRKGGELLFTTRLGGGSAGTAQLEEAWRSGIPVDGKVAKEIKGGYEITLPGNVRAFCPFSQLGLRRGDNPEEALGRSLPFRISQFGEQGRNIVVSHREIVEEERRQQREALKESLKEGMVVKGTVTNLRDFGAFVDIGGLEGLLPISEISYSRVEDINDILQVGQELELILKKIDWEQNRFSFSLRDTLADPWSKVGTIYKVGSTHSGKVARLANFGAFVTIGDGIDGLVHISRLGEGKRLKHAQEVLSLGQQLEVTIEKIDLEARRISLVPATAGETEPEQTSYQEQPGTAMGTFADLLKQAQAKKKR